MICAVCFGYSLDEIEKQIELVINQKISIIEVRLDGLETIDYVRLGKIAHNQPFPVILTLRSEWKDLPINPPSEGRKQILTDLLQLKPHYIDLEFPRDVNLIKQTSDETGIILSLLDFHGMAKISIEAALDLVKINEKMIIKIAATPNSVEDLKLLWKWSAQMARLNIPNIIIGMGELGKLTRIKSLELKNLWMYGRAEQIDGEPFIPGMLPIKTLIRAFSEDSWHFAIIENNSKIETEIFQPIMDAILFEAEISGVITDLPINNRVDLGQLLLWVNDGLLDGVQISYPWQQEVISHLDELDHTTKITDRVNFVVPTKNGLRGYNTHVEAINRCLSPYSKKRLNSVYIEGEDNFIKPIVAAIRGFTNLIVVRGIREESVKNLIQEFPEVTSSEESFTDTFDLVINNLSPEVGFERISPIPPVILDQAKVVFDPISSIFNKSATLLRAEKLQTPIVGSWEFILNSLLYGFELWTKQSIPMQSLSAERIFTSEYFNKKFIWPLHSGYSL